MNEIITTGMILSVMPIGEYDRRIELLSAGLGRISVFARGARKPGSSLVSVTRVFAFGEFTLFQGKSSYTLQSAAIHRYFDELTGDMDRVYYGFYFLELAQYFSRENLEARDMLKLLYFSLRALSTDSLHLKLVKSITEVKMLALNGLCPSPERLSAGQGSYMFAKNVSAGCLRAFTHVVNAPAEHLFSFSLSPEVEQEFSGIAGHLLRMSTDREFKAEKLLEPGL